MDYGNNYPRTEQRNKTTDVITSLVNREIYTESGLFVGDVYDVKLDFSSLEISHIIVKEKDLNPQIYTLPRGKSGIKIPYRWVRSVGDIIIINNIKPQKPTNKIKKIKSV